MVYIVLGIVSFVLVLVLLFADRYSTYSEMMSSFKEGTYKKLLITLSVATIAFVSYGIYFELTYQPPFLDIEVEEKSHTVFGNIGELGYYAETLVYKDQEIDMHLVSWEKFNSDKAEIIVDYPSGKEDKWEAELTPLNETLPSALKEEYQIQNIYKLSPYTFKEKGDVELTITDGANDVGSFEIEVK